MKRSKLAFKKLTPMAASEQIINRYYGKNARFSKALDEMKLVLGSANNETNNYEKQEVVKNRSAIEAPSVIPVVQTFKCKKIVICLRRLTKEDIKKMREQNSK